ncbi:MAG: sugar ABC transporter ATP-binding protein [Nakamurella sp.]
MRTVDPEAPPGDAPGQQTLLSVRGLTKAFLGTQALDGVDFDVRSGEIHALLGQNGAGKSTLIKILAGVHHQDAGTIQRPSPDESGDTAIAFIHQDLGLVAGMTVAENIALVSGYPRRAGLVSWRAVLRRATEVLRTLQVEVQPTAEVSTLTPAERSLVAIARALALGAKIVVLDEPTAALPEGDVEKLVAALTRLRDHGAGIVYVTHRIDEVFRLADRVTVLRDGRLVTTCNVDTTTPTQLIRSIVGKDLAEAADSGQDIGDHEILVLDSVAAAGGAVGPVSLTVRAGEILGLVGLSGAGQSEIGRAVFGALPLAGGSMKIDGRRFAPSSPADAVALGIGFVSGSRVAESTASELTVRENLYINPVALGGRPLRPTARAAENQRAQDALRAYDIRPRDPERLIGSLSGGNQQKAVVARWLETDSRLLILEEPTAGVDVGSKADIYRLLLGVADRRGAVLVISADFEEVIRICHRTLVFNRGRVAADIPCAGLTVAKLTQLAAGHRQESGADHDD